MEVTIYRLKVTETGDDLKRLYEAGFRRSFAIAYTDGKKTIWVVGSSPSCQQARAQAWQNPVGYPVLETDGKVASLRRSESYPTEALRLEKHSTGVYYVPGWIRPVTLTDMDTVKNVSKAEYD